MTLKQIRTSNTLMEHYRIVVSSYTRGRTGADKVPELLLGRKATFEYGAFTRFDVETPDASLTPPAKP